MEAIGKTPECVEQGLGEALAARNAAVANVEDVPGVGPPDLCWIQRTAKGIFNTKKPKMQGYYHWVVGLAVTSSASIAAYFARLTSTDKKVGYFQGMGVGREFAIERGIYCCYDPFTDMDIWVEIALPGGAVSRALDRQGFLHDVTADMWKGAHVGCFLRSLMYDVSVTLHCSRAFQYMMFFKGQEDETELLDNVVELYQTHSAQRATVRLHWDTGRGTEPYHMDILCMAILEHFKTRRRWQRALQFFMELQEFFPSSVVYLAEIYKELDNMEGAADVVKSALQNVKKEDHPMMVLACGYVCLQDDRPTKAMKIAWTVLDKDPQVRPAWFLLSRSLLCQGLYDKSLRALHLMPPPLIPSDRRIQLFRILPSDPKSVTRHTHYDPEAAELRTLYDESQRRGMQIAVLPGQILAPRTQSHGTDWGLISSTQSVMRAAYDLLLDTVQNVGWEKFCKIRAAVFLLSSEEEASMCEKSEWHPVVVELVIHPELAPTGKVVTLSLNFKENAPWEKPRRKATALYARSMSTGTPNTRPERDTTTFETSNAPNLASKVLTKGLGQVTKKVLRRLSSSSTVVHEDTEQAMSPTSETASDEFSTFFRAPEKQDRTSELDADNEEELSVSPKVSVEGVVSKEQPEESLRKRVEIVTTAQRLSSDDEVPDAPENALPKQCPPYSTEQQTPGPPSSTGFSQDKWQVKIVSMGIKERVKYFDQMAKSKIANQVMASESSRQLEHEPHVASMRPRRARYSITHTIMEKLINDIPFPESTTDSASHRNGNVSGETEEGELESSSSYETGLPVITDWGSFALDEASHVPRTSGSRHPTRTSLFGGFGSDAYPDVSSDAIHRNVHDAEPCECAEWLDELILALWEDLAIYTDLKGFDRRLKSKNMQTHAEQILGTIEWNTESSDDDDLTRTPSAGPSLPDTHPVDWMRRGLLCERLRKMADAEQAYRVCVFESFNLTSLLALSHVYSSWGYCKGSMLILNRLAQFHHKKHSAQKSTYVPISFVKQISQLVESVGNKELKSAAENSHPLITRALDDVIRWRLRSPSGNL